MASVKRQIEAIQTKAASLVEQADALVEAMEEAYESMSERAQDGPRGEKLQERIDTVNMWSDSLQEIVDEVL